jgi:hypothetical protein
MNYQNNTTPKPHKMTVRDRHRLALLLNNHCSSVDGYAVYEDGWDDHRVAAELSLSVAMVSYARRGIFGKYAPAPVKEKKVDLATRVADLEAQVEKLVAALGGNL